MSAPLTLLGCSGGGGADDLMRRAKRGTASSDTETADAAASEASAPVATEMPSAADVEVGASASSTGATTPEEVSASEATPVTPSVVDPGIPAHLLASDPGADSFDDYRGRMEEIGKAFAAEMAATKSFPRPSILDNNGNETLSWRVRILPKLGYEELYRKFNLNEPWNSPNNLALLPYMPKVFRSGSSEVGKTCVQVPRSPYTLFPLVDGETRVPGLTDITDGIGSTVILVLVSPSRAVPWTAPEDYVVSDGDDVKDLARSGRETYLVMWADGRAAEIRAGSFGSEYRSMMTYRGREAFTARDIEYGIDTSPTSAPALETDATTSSEVGVAGSGATAPSLDLPDRIASAAAERIANRSWEHAAELLYLSELLRSESSADLRGGYLPATGGMTAFVRIGLGTTCPLSSRTPTANPIRIQEDERNDSFRMPGQLEEITGDLGRVVLSDLLRESDGGRLGIRQTLSEVRADAAPESRFVRLGIEYLGNQRLMSLLEAARVRGLDLLFHFDVELSTTRQNQISNTTIFQIIEVRTGEKVFESLPINNIREMRADSSLTLESNLAKARVKYQEFLADSICLRPEFEPTPDDVRVRVSSLVDKIERPDWNAALEIREYFRRGLISRVEFEKAYYSLLMVDPQSFAIADEETRLGALLATRDASFVLVAREAKTWVPKPRTDVGEIE